jgi:hypothetical protein
MKDYHEGHEEHEEDNAALGCYRQRLLERINDWCCDLCATQISSYLDLFVLFVYFVVLLLEHYQTAYLTAAILRRTRTERSWIRILEKLVLVSCTSSFDEKNGNGSPCSRRASMIRTEMAFSGECTRMAWENEKGDALSRVPFW